MKNEEKTREQLITKLSEMHKKIDITDRKQAEEKLKKRNEDLEKWGKVTVGREL